MASLINKSLKLKAALPLQSSVRLFNYHEYMCPIHPVAVRDPDYKRLDPFPYKTLKYNHWKALRDVTSCRFDQYTKLIVVDGPFGSGKKEVCKGLAEALDFHWVQDPIIDQFFIDPVTGMDLRDYDYVAAYNIKPFDLQKFWRDPFDERVMQMQHRWHNLRIWAYVLALRHIYSTGQGVVMNRSVFSNLVNVAAMVEAGFLPKRYLSYYHKQRCDQLGNLKRPHLNIYLDVPMGPCMDRIRKRNYKHDATSKFYTEELFSAWDSIYKNDFYDRANRHAEMIVMDWKDDYTLDDIVAEIETLEFFDERHSECKQKDWCMSYERTFKEYRWRLFHQFDELDDVIYAHDLNELPELYIDIPISLAWESIENEAHKNHPIRRREEDYNSLFALDIPPKIDNCFQVDDVRNKFPEKLSTNIFNEQTV